MANYNLVVNSRFKPFSFDELLKPALIATQAHEKMEEELANTELDLGQLGNFIDEDSNAANTYNTYMDTLKSQVDALATTGLQGISREDRLNLKRDLGRKIIPIKNAITTRNAQIQKEINDEAQGILYNTHAADTSIDDYINNPTLEHARTDTKASMNRIAMRAATIGKQLQEGVKDIGKLDKFTRRLVEKYGIGIDNVNDVVASINNALAGNQNTLGNNILSTIIADEMKATGVDNWNSESKIKWFNTVAPALYGAAGEEKAFQLKDEAAMMSAQDWYAQQRETRAQKNAKDMWDYQINHPKPETSERYLKGDNGLIYDTKIKKWLNSKGEVLHRQPSTTEGKLPGINKYGEEFKGFQFKMWNIKGTSKADNWKRELTNERGFDASSFDKGDEHLVSIDDFNEEMRHSIIDELAKYNKTIEDVDIYEDEDDITDNHYQIRPKIKSEPTSTPPTTSGQGDNTEEVNDSTKTGKKPMPNKHGLD